MKKKTAAKPKTVDGYLAKLGPDKRAALEQLRRTIHTVMPKAEECISYQLPAFRLNGKVVVWIGAGANHCAFYPGGAVNAFKTELADYETSKGTIRFQPSHPLPARLVRKLIKARIERLWPRAVTSPRRGR